MAFFEGLVTTEDGTPAEVAWVGADSFYVIDDQGFHRHIDAREVDRQVLTLFVEQLQMHREEATQAMLGMLGQDDLFTKGMVEATVRNLDVDQVLGQSLPLEARQMLGMMGFQVIIDMHGEVLHVEMPSATDADDDED
jgi:hypothetical protein